MQVVLSEAQESYKADIIMVCQSDTVDDQSENLEQIATWIQNWISSRS
jgi:hypothetical protein